MVDDQEPSESKLKPRTKDICFGKNKHGGNIVWREAISKEAKRHIHEEYCPEIHKQIRKSLGT